MDIRAGFICFMFNGPYWNAYPKYLLLIHTYNNNDNNNNNNNNNNKLLRSLQTPGATINFLYILHFTSHFIVKVIKQ